MTVSMPAFSLPHFLPSFDNLQEGSLRLITPDGRTHVFSGAAEGVAADMTIKDWRVVRRALARGDVALGEDYVQGLWDSSDVEALFVFFLRNFDTFEKYAHGNWLQRFFFSICNKIIRRNSKAGSKANIAAHYDVGNDFYRLWLDDSMTYSSAIYAQGHDTLEAAQQQKYNRILSRTDGDSVLEIGCGWGGFAAAAADQGRTLTGLTVSPAQHRYATERLGGKADIQLQDYRDSNGTFDSIVSIEMFEAVGEQYWPSYFRTVADRLKRGGTALIQTITIRDELFAEYRKRGDFIRHYVFPGGMLPSAQVFEQQARAAGLKLREQFAFGQDYARTLREWLQRLDAKREDILALGYSEAFIRNWRFYLALCAAGFAAERTDVVQMELVHAG